MEHFLVLNWAIALKTCEIYALQAFIRSSEDFLNEILMKSKEISFHLINILESIFLGT